MACGIGANHFDAVFFQRAAAVQSHGGIQRRLAAERRQQNQFALGAHPLHFLDFARDDFFDALRRDRLDVSAVGELRIGHDRGRVGIHQDDAITLFAQALCRPACRNNQIRKPGR